MTRPFLTPYLFFGGRCEEAFAFYRQAIGAKVEFLMHYKDSPEAPPPGTLQAGFEDKVMHATLTVGSSCVMASDGCDDKSHFQGFSLSLSWPDEAAAQRAFDALAVGGEVQMPLAKTFWSPCFGMVTDRFGIAWMITVFES